jgi:Ca2+/H+ antiporter, TMEM165/GDT1 family
VRCPLRANFTAIIDGMGIRNVVTAFATVFPAELPDKTMVATLVLSSRYRRPGWTWVGVAGAFVVHVLVAVAAGSLIGRLSPKLVSAITGSIFLVGAISLWRESRRHVETGDDETNGSGGILVESIAARRVVGASFLAVLVAEWGDLTQLATASLAAKRDDPIGVGIGALLALWSVAALAALAGRVVLKVLPVSLVQKVAAVLFAGLALWSWLDVIR